MNGFARFLGKEAKETVRTWRIWVLPGVLMFFALSGPILAKLTPELLESLGGAEQGVVIQVPPPTYLDAYGQWVKNLSQMAVFLLIGVAAGMVAGERSRGTAALVLTKPVSRGGFVVAKYVSQAALLVLATSVGTFVTWAVTAVVFGEAPPERLVVSSAAWLTFALVLLAVMALLSCAFSTLAAIGAGVGVFALLGILTLWGPAVRYSPAGLMGAPSAVLVGKTPELAWPLATGAVAVVLLVAAAVWVFGRKEI